MEKKEDQLREAAEKRFPKPQSWQLRESIPSVLHGSLQIDRVLSFMEGAKSEAAKQYHSSNDSVEGLREKLIPIFKKEVGIDGNKMVQPAIAGAWLAFDWLLKYLHPHLQKQQESDAVDWDEVYKKYMNEHPDYYSKHCKKSLPQWLKENYYNPIQIKQ